jgi:hypothetical protein
MRTPGEGAGAAVANRPVVSVRELAVAGHWRLVACRFGGRIPGGAALKGQRIRRSLDRRGSGGARRADAGAEIQPCRRGATKSPYAERLYALVALLRIEPGGEAAVEAAFHKLGAEVNDLRLRAEIIHRLYGKPFGPAEVTKLLTGISESGGSENISGVVWSLPDHMPPGDIPAVLDGLTPNRDELGAGGPHEREVGRFIDGLLIRAWSGIMHVEPGRALSWLRLRHSYSRDHRGGRTDELRMAVQEQPERLQAMTDHFLETLVPDKEAWWRLIRLLFFK